MKRHATYEIRGPGGTLHVRPDDSVAIDLAMLIEGETSGRPLDEVLAVYGRSTIEKEVTLGSTVSRVVAAATGGAVFPAGSENSASTR